MAKGSKRKGPASGVEFPLDDNNQRSTMAVNSETFAVAAEAGGHPELAHDIRSSAKGWRKRYAKYVVEHAKASAGGRKDALDMATAGLEYLHGTMVFVRNERSMPLRTSMHEFKEHDFYTGHIKGKRRKAVDGGACFEVPYKKKVLSGDALSVQIDKWVREGVVEVSAGANMNALVENAGEWLDLSDVYFVMLGASSAMGPYEFLLRHGAHVVAVDIDRPQVWEKLIATARSSPGTLTFPLKKPQSTMGEEELAANAGCNLLTETPEVRNWLQGVHKGKRLVVGSYAYLDGALFVKISVAMDAVVKGLLTSRKGTSLAYLCTPTDVHVATPAAMAAAQKNCRKSPMWQSVLSLLCSVIPGKHMAPNKFQHVTDDEGNTFHLVDAIVPDQGPNYILAKRLQHWRAMLARESGSLVSTNIAPSTRTLSVVSNVSFKMAYVGMEYFKPMEVMDQDTSSAVMAGLLVYDLRCHSSTAHPSVKLKNPLCLYTENSFHGGIWRCGYKFSTIGTASVLIYLFVAILVPLYLFIYNAIQVYGWSLVAHKAVMAVSERGMQRPDYLWDPVSSDLRFFQDLAFMEVLHSVLGLTSSPVFTTLMQVLSRVALVEGLAYVPSSQNSVFIAGCLFAWCLTEIVRYSFYALKLIEREVSVLTWLRYSMFLVLYPIGVFSELCCIYHVVDGFPFWGDAKNAIAGHVPFLFRFNVKQIVTIQLLKLLGLLVWYGAYVPNFPILFSYMLVQRRKVLNPKHQEGTKSSTKIKTN